LGRRFVNPSNIIEVHGVSERVPWYGWQRWRKRARHQLREHPLCAMCLQQGIVVPATVADHVVPHKQNQRAFWFGTLQSLCAAHHNITKQLIELHGYSTDVDADGWPIDRRHPANRIRN
jgi:5-methylcytosine-specific restriction endonuclease McrA